MYLNHYRLTIMIQILVQTFTKHRLLRIKLQVCKKFFYFIFEKSNSFGFFSLHLLIGTPVVTVTATDPDEDSRLHYEITTGKLLLRGQYNWNESITICICYQIVKM